MVIGLVATVASRWCPEHHALNNNFALFMYLSYFYLFAQLFYQKYMRDKARAKQNKAKAKKVD